LDTGQWTKSVNPVTLSDELSIKVGEFLTVKRPLNFLPIACIMEIVNVKLNIVLKIKT
jgi:hypothetical protein